MKVEIDMPDRQLARLFVTLEEQKSAILGSVAVWGDRNIRIRPSPAEWSALDILDHLRRTEAAILSAMLGLENGPETPQPVSAADNLRGLFLVLLFRTPARVKAPGPVSQIFPDDPASLQAVAIEWAQTRQNLSRFLSTVSHGVARRPAFRHPVGGWMTLPRTLQFLSAHIIHHRFQLKRVFRRLAKAGARH